MGAAASTVLRKPAWLLSAAYWSFRHRLQSAAAMSHLSQPQPFYLTSNVVQPPPPAPASESLTDTMGRGEGAHALS